MILPGADHHHLAGLDLPREAREARTITRAVDPSGAHNRHRYPLVRDQALQQPFTSDLRLAVGVGLRPEGCGLVRLAVDVDPMNGDGTNVHDPPYAGQRGGSYQVLQPAHVRPLVLGRRAPWSRPGGTVEYSIDSAQGYGDPGMVVDIGGPDVHIPSCQRAQAVART